MGEVAPRDRGRRVGEVLAIVGVGLVWACLAWWGVRGHSATFDEPVHVAAAIAAVQKGELGVNAEHPPVWKYLAGLPHAGRETGLDLSVFALGAVRGDAVAQWAWAVGDRASGREGLYSTGEGDDAVARSRAAMLGFGVALVVLAGLLGRRLAEQSGLTGRWVGGAGVLAAGLVGIDPLVMGHGALVTNDVAWTAVMVGIVWLGWEVRQKVGRAGSRWTWELWGGVGLGVLAGVGACIKFTGVVLGPGLVLGLLLVSRRPAVMGVVVSAAVAWGTVWGCYGFRYAPGADGRLIDTTAIAVRVGELRRVSEGLRETPPADEATRMLLGVERARVLPQAFTAGLLTSYGVTRGNPSYALEMHSMRGWWWYFPFAMLVKTPVGLLAVWAWGAVWGVRRGGELRVVVLCAVGVLMVSMASPLNIGVRHVMGVGVLLGVVGAVAVAGGLQRAGRVRWAAAALVAAVVVESAGGGRDGIAFFNLPARAYGERRLLGDSNLDWGQDLARLAEWRKANPQGTVYLAYWGTADPGWYGLDREAGVVNLPGTYPYAVQGGLGERTGQGWLVVSESYLQGVQSGRTGALYEWLKRERPMGRVGRTMWVYRW